ncbi:MAG: SGNH/GDSL hydrolase family protein [Candidatus Thermoplasmatota archaeon]|nr:SGNH/GDSL hydrolase family protein [Candidatus Thermoplasmatota archaeon]
MVQAQDESTPEEENRTFQYHTIASLGDSTLGSDPSGYRGPFASVHAANLMGLDYYEGAVGGDRSWTLIDAGRHTTIADNYGNGTLVTMMVGAWDFIDSDVEIISGDYSFIDELDENITIILDTLVASEVDVLVWNLPNMSFLPFLTQIFPTDLHHYFTEASAEWAQRLDEIAERYGDDVQVFDLMTASDDLLQNTSARTILGNEITSPPMVCAKNCIMVDSLHPTSVGQGLLANYMMDAINEKFPPPNGSYPLLSEEDLLSLTTLTNNSEEETMQQSSIFIEGDVTKACFDWAETTYRDMYLTITIDEEYVPIPSYIGFNSELCRQSTHVIYSGEEAIHVVTNVENTLTLNHFFEIWGENLSATKLFDKDTSNGGEITIDVNGINFEGNWSAISLDDVISLEIVYTSPPTPTVEDDVEDDSLPGFSVFLVLASTLLAMAAIRRK